jgi:hypothetical protein
VKCGEDKQFATRRFAVRREQGREETLDKGVNVTSCFLSQQQREAEDTMREMWVWVVLQCLHKEFYETVPILCSSESQVPESQRKSIELCECGDCSHIVCTGVRQQVRQ